MRHRVVQSANRRQLEEAVHALMEQGWRPVGESTMAAPDDLRELPHWVRVLYFASAPVPLEVLRLPPPAGSRFSGDEGR